MQRPVVDPQQQTDEREVVSGRRFGAWLGLINHGEEPIARR
ncbi:MULTISPECIES: hypothetical protein [unclassified Curtobacterium]|nr:MULTISPECIES: hypothetical protein [unclassified Curtobacterium]WIB67041.1 hypothetical protein DEI93_13925 [Curtobacterium sp. MCBD17_035]